MKLGIIGLGRMGGDLALQCLDKGIDVVGHAKHGHPALAAKGVRVVSTYDALAHALEQPRLIYLSLPAGPTVDEVIGELLPYLAKGDVLMDGGNSFYEDSVRREKELRAKGILFLDCGTSGGVTGARNGACFMVGGPAEGFAIAEPVLRMLAVEGGLLHTGAPGSGHFVKLVHNGIEFGMNHAIGEGVEMLLHGGYDLDMEKIFENWSHGSVIRGWLVELMAQGLRERDFGSISPYVEDTGEVDWLIQVAIDKEIAMPITAMSVMSLFMSRGSGQDNNRAVALLRHGYGGHPFGKDEAVAKERKTSRISKI
ncbi:MAG TPA: decarboxylating 6-phosphogluconate dehydrogenase [Methanocella sp.]